MPPAPDLSSWRSPGLWDWFAAACAWVVLVVAVWAGSGIAVQPEPAPARPRLTAPPPQDI